MKMVSRQDFILSILVIVLISLTTCNAVIFPAHDGAKFPTSSSLQKILANGNFSDCNALLKAGFRETGIYNLTFNGVKKEAVCYYNGSKAYTVIQQRLYGNVDFNQRLSTYAAGFGNSSGDYWLGLNFIRRLVELGNTQLQITMTSWDYRTVTANYGWFSIGTQAQGWPLNVGNYYGDVADDLNYSNGRIFYASDVPDPSNCAINQRSGWWYNYCAYALLNGKYYSGGKYTPSGSYYDGIYWKDWLGYDYSLKQVTMAVTHAAN